MSSFQRYLQPSMCARWCMNHCNRPRREHHSWSHPADHRSYQRIRVHGYLCQHLRKKLCTFLQTQSLRGQNNRTSKLHHSSHLLLRRSKIHHRSHYPLRSYKPLDPCNRKLRFRRTSSHRLYFQQIVPQGKSEHITDHG